MAPPERYRPNPDTPNTKEFNIQDQIDFFSISIKFLEDKGHKTRSDISEISFYRRKIEELNKSSNREQVDITGDEVKPGVIEPPTPEIKQKSPRRKKRALAAVDTRPLYRLQLLQISPEVHIYGSESAPGKWRNATQGEWQEVFESKWKEEFGTEYNPEQVEENPAPVVDKKPWDGWRENEGKGPTYYWYESKYGPLPTSAPKKKLRHK